MSKKVLNVTRVGFSGKTGDNRSPESFPFPACLTSLVEALNEPYPWETMHANGRTYTHRVANDIFLTVSGMAFGLLWRDDCCPSCLDLTQVADHDEVIRRAFSWAQYQCDIVERTDGNEKALFARVVDSIDRGVPALAFGLPDIPECSIITGYDEGALVGWSHFHDGECTLPDWHQNLWKLVFVGERNAEKYLMSDALRWGVSIMESTEADGYLAGEAAYAAWITMLRNLHKLPEQEIEAKYGFHRRLLFCLAEARCWGGHFLSDGMDEENAGQCFRQIHDLCWKTDAETGDEGWRAMKRAEVCEKVAARIEEIRALDRRAIELLKKEIEWLTH